MPQKKRQAIARHLGIEGGKTYLLDIAWESGNVIHHVIGYVDPFNEVPEWVQLFNPTYEHQACRRWDLDHFEYLHVVRELDVPFRFKRDGDMELPKDVL